jgi:hypothetical protein
VEERVGDPDGREGVRGVVHAARRDVGQDEGPETGAGAGAGAGHPCPAAVETDAGRGLLGGGRGEVLGGAGGGGRGMGCARGEKERRGHGVGADGSRPKRSEMGYFWAVWVFAFAVYPIRERRRGKERDASLLAILPFKRQ